MAYLLQVHQNIEQIKILIKKLQGLKKEDIHIFVHVDGKNMNLKTNLQNYYKDSNTVIILPTSINVNWGGISQIRATLKSLEEIVHSTNDYKYVHLLSGQDYPLKTSEEIYEFFSKTNKNYIEYKNVSSDYWRLKCFNLFSENKNNRVLIIRIIDKVIREIQKKINLKRKNLLNINLYKGSQWFSLTKEAIGYCLKKAKEENLLKEYKYTYCSDEHFFQNILCNSKFKDTIINDNQRYIQWETGNSPKTFTLDEVKKIEKDTTKLWIRKI